MKDTIDPQGYNRHQESHQESGLDTYEEDLQIMALKAKQKRLEVDLIELAIKQKKQKMQLKMSNTIQYKSKSPSSFKRMAQEEIKDRSFEYFEEQDLEYLQDFSSNILPEQTQMIFKSKAAPANSSQKKVDESYNNMIGNHRQSIQTAVGERTIEELDQENQILPQPINDNDNLNAENYRQRINLRPSSTIKAKRNPRLLQDEEQKSQVLGSLDKEFEESPRNTQNDVNTEHNYNNSAVISPIEAINIQRGEASLNVGPSEPLNFLALQHGPALQRASKNRSRKKQLLNQHSQLSMVQTNCSRQFVKMKVSKKKQNWSEKQKSARKQQKKDGPDDEGPGSFQSPMEMLGNSNFEEEEGELNFFEPISFSKLEKVISKRHPIDPETKSRFDFKERVTVNEYEAKLSDMCYCYAANKFLKEKAKALKKLIEGPKEKIARPPSMQDLPESNSSSDDEEDSGTKGLTQCSIALGEGATLYLQMMKTLSIMFVILTIMNIPLFSFYELNTTGNQMGDFTKAFKYFTLGNLGQMDKKCSWSTFEQHFNESYANENSVTVDCGQGYIGELLEFGFLYQFDKLYGGDSIASERCKFIENPMIRYKKPAPKPFCTDEQLENLDLETQTECRVKLTNEAAEIYPQVETKLEDMSQIDTNTTEDLEIKGTANNVDPLCNFVNKTKHTDNLWSSKEAETAFVTWFERECYFNQSCTFDVNKIGKSFQDSQNNKGSKKDEESPGDVGKKELTLFEMVSDNCKSRMSEYKVTSYQYIGVVGCKYDDVKVPFTKSTRLHKEWIGIIILLCDILSILMMYYFFSSIRRLNLEILVAMDDLQVQMKDFGIKIDDVKLDRYTQDSRLIKMKIWLHFTNLFRNKEMMKEHTNEDSEDQENQESSSESQGEEQKIQDRMQINKSPQKLRSFMRVHPVHQVLDVCLSIYTQPSIQCVFRMQDIQLEINEINNKLRSGGYKGEDIPEKQDELKALVEKQKRFEERYNQLTRKKKLQPGQTMTVERVSKTQRLKEIQYMFVIFKDCETANVVHSMYPQEKSILNKEKQELLVFGKQPKVVPILEPDQIIWENLAFAKDQQKVRSYIVEVISMFFLLGNTLFTMYLSGFKLLINKKIPALNCDSELTYTKIEAYKDQMKINQGESSTGLLSCYCSRETSLYAPWHLIPHNFAEFQNLRPELQDKAVDNWNYCAEWQLLQIVKSVLMFLISTSAVFINEIVADFFQQLGQYQKKHTKIEEQILCFRQIFIQEYINMGIIILITSFDNIGVKATLLGDLAGRYNVYTGFDPNWYMDYGNKICVFIFVSSFVVNFKDVIKYVLTEIKRFRDRSFKMNLKLDPEDEGCDQPNTKLRIQSDLEALYTGNPFKGEKAYSRMMSTLFVILMYSSGMPIMYFTGAVFYIVTFMVNKFLLINFYQKSRTLTRTIPLFAIDFMQYALFMHSFVSLLMLTNPIAFQTKNRYQEGILIGVDPPINMTAAIHNVTVWFLAEEGVSNLEETAHQVESNQIAKFLIKRLQFFHQQMFLAFLFTYVTIMFLGKTIYGILYLTFLMIFKMISTIVSMIKKQARETRLRVQNKLLLRQKMISEKADTLALQNREVAPQDSFKSDSSMRNEVISGLNNEESLNQENPGAGTVMLDNAFQNVFESPEDKVKRERREKLQQTRKESKVKKKLNRPDYSDNILIELSCENLSNFYQRCKRERQEFWEIFRWDREIGAELLTDDFEEFADHRTLFLETLYTYRITQDSVILYQNFLNQRLSEIEEIVDKYFKLFNPVLVSKMREGFKRDRERQKKLGKEGGLKDQVKRRKYEEWALQHSDDVQFDDLKQFPHERKLKILTEYQEDLIQAEKDKKDNRQGIQQICRMTGSLAQSYFIFDASNYKVGRKIYFSVAEEEDKQEDQDDIGALLSNSEASSSSASSSESSKDQSQETKRSKQTSVRIGSIRNNLKT